MNDNFKIWINENLVNNKGFPNPRKAAYSYMESYFPKQLNTIKSLTPFLPDDSPNAERLYCIMNNLSERKTCEMCDNPVAFISYIKGYKPFCSPSCGNKSKKTQEKIKTAKIEKYGENAQEIFNEKRKQTNLERYGAENVMELDSFKEKIKETNLEKYGVENIFQAEEVKNKIRSTMIKKYGVENPSQIKELKDKIKESQRRTFMKRYDRENIAQINISQEHLENLNDKEWLIEQHYKQKKSCIKIGKEIKVASGTVGNYLRKNEIELKNYKSSEPEKEIIEIFPPDIEVITNSRQIIDRKELDIYIPKYNIAIEYHGLYWHSSGSKEEDVFSKERHLKKLKMCEEKGIQLFQIFENEWLDPIKKNIWKSVINEHLNNNKKIYANKCEVQEIDSETAFKFLSLNHIQGNERGSVELGLFYENELVSAMVLNKSRHNTNYEYEITRFCNKTYTSVTGGVSKLLLYFVKNYNPKSIISYADRRYSQGNLYKKLGFEYLETSDPNYFWFKNNIMNLYSCVRFEKQKLKDILENYNPNLSESENMYVNKYRRIWDCGNLVFGLTIR